MTFILLNLNQHLKPVIIIMIFTGFNSKIIWEGEFDKEQIQLFLIDFYSQDTISIDDVRQWKKT